MPSAPGRKLPQEIKTTAPQPVLPACSAELHTQDISVIFHQSWAVIRYHRNPLISTPPALLQKNQPIARAGELALLPFESGFFPLKVADSPEKDYEERRGQVSSRDAPGQGRGQREPLP